jgi:hypothetical protein
MAHPTITQRLIGHWCEAETTDASLLYVLIRCLFVLLLILRRGDSAERTSWGYFRYLGGHPTCRDSSDPLFFKD